MDSQDTVAASFLREVAAMLMIEIAMTLCLVYVGLGRVERWLTTYGWDEDEEEGLC